MNEKDDEKDEIEVEYELETFDIAGYRFQIHTIAFLPIEILLQNQSQGVEISGQKLWCGSVAIIQYILEHKECIENKTVIELGAGTGVLGMLCSKLGQCKVILTDYDVRSLQHMSMDCEINQVKAEIKELNWFSFSIRQWNYLEETEKILIVAGDVVYKKVLIEPFFNVVTQLFHKYGNNIEMLLCHIPRADVKHVDIMEAIQSRNLDVMEINPLEWRKGYCIELSPEEDYDRACIYHIRSTVGVVNK